MEGREVWMYATVIQTPFVASRLFRTPRRPWLGRPAAWVGNGSWEWRFES